MNHNIEKRIEKIEDKLNVNERPKIVGIVFFVDGDLPPETTENNVTIRYVRYSDLKARLEK